MRKCQETKTPFMGMDALGCGREDNHQGYHFDRFENLYWFPGAPKLETFEFDTGKESDQ